MPIITGQRPSLGVFELELQKESSGDGSWGRKLQRGSALFPNLRSQSSVREQDPYTQREAEKGLMQVPEQLNLVQQTFQKYLPHQPVLM